MSALRACAICALPLLLCGCLEVDQAPGWVRGQYQGKADTLPYQANFHNDRLAWSAAIADRNHKQNEYERANP